MPSQKANKYGTAVVVLLLLAGCSGGAQYATPSDTRTASTTAMTTATPDLDMAPRVSIGAGIIRNETVGEVFNTSVPAEYVNVKFRRAPSWGVTYAVATNCTEFRAPVTLNATDTPSWNIATNRTHDLSEWEIVKVARVDTGEIVATHSFDRTPDDCSPAVPDTEAA